MPSLLALVVLCATLFALPAAARAADMTPVGAPLSAAKDPNVPPPGFKVSERQAMRIASSLPKVRKAVAGHEYKVSPFIWDGWRWEVTYDHGSSRYASVAIAPDGRVLDVWTGVAASSFLVRGGFNTMFAHWWIWLTFGLLFLVPFVDVKRPFRLLHLDLLALLSFGISYAYFDYQHGDAAVYWFYPPLAYMLVRLVVAGVRRRRGAGRLVPSLPTWVLLVGVIGLFGARVALNVDSKVVMDIGYASVVGADRIAHKQELYVDNEQHGDTYGPINYIAYIPFELALPWKGQWDRVPAAHAGTLFFDLMTLLGLFLLGRQLRAGPEGRRLGLALAWAWAAFPFTLLGVMENTNDGLVAMLLVWMLVAWRTAWGRGGVLGLAAAAKFIPGALLLLIARGDRRLDRRDWRSWLICAGACLGIFAFTFAMYWPKGGLQELWNCTLGYQLHRDPDLSFWTVHNDALWSQKLVQAGALLLTAVVAFFPRGERSIGQVAALMGAVTIAFQLPAGHWFYFYIMWFLPLALFALFAEHHETAAVAASSSDEDDDATVADVAALGGVGVGGRLAA